MHPAGMIAPVMAGLTLSSIAFIALHREIESLASLATAERAFAARCGEVGIRQSFLENFAPSGIFFGPAPSIAVIDLKKRPEEPQPPNSNLFWAPETGDVSAAGDLGYTTGPYRFTPKDSSKPARYGQYFSVWQRESPDSPWKVALDFGTSAGTSFANPDQTAFRPAKDFEKSTARPGASQEELMSAEETFYERAKIGRYFDALKAAASAYPMVNRDAPIPSLPLSKAKDLLSEFGKTREWTVLGSGISKSGDLGFTYGRYALESRHEHIVKGFFARVWKRDEKGDWKIVADIANRVSDAK